MHETSQMKGTVLEEKKREGADETRVDFRLTACQMHVSHSPVLLHQRNPNQSIMNVKSETEGNT